MDLGALTVKLLAKVVAAIVQAGGRAIRPAGRANLQALAEAVIRARQRFLISDQIGVLSGFEIDVRAEDEVSGSFARGEHRQVLALVNHFADCPLGVVGNAILTSHGLKTMLGVEPTVIFGMGASVVTLLRDRVSRVTNIVMVGGLRISLGSLDVIDMRKSTSAEIFSRLRAGESVSIYPEKKNSRELIAGDFRCGRIILHSAELGIPIVPVAVHFSNGVFHLAIGRFLVRDHIISLATSSTDKESAGRRVVEYAMDEIARGLPERLRGRYAARPTAPPQPLRAQ